MASNRIKPQIFHVPNQKTGKGSKKDETIKLNRNGAERTKTDLNGPKRTFVGTETDFLGTETDLSGYRNGPRRTGTDRNVSKRTFVDTETDFLGTETAYQITF